MRRSCAEPGDEARPLAFEDRPADTHDPHRTDRHGDHDADGDALQQEYQKQSEIPPVQRGQSRAMLFAIAGNFRAAGGRYDRHR